jgi:hypothetical protein
MTVKWETKNVPSSHKTLSMRLRVYPNGQDYYLPFDGKNDGQESVSIPPYIPGGSYILEIKSDVNGTTVMDASDSYVKIVDTPTPTASEQVKCVFKGATTVQSCDNASESDTPFPFSCSGIGSCVADLKGPKGLSVTWKSSCGGYAYTTLDGESEYATFSCGKTTVPKN